MSLDLTLECPCCGTDMASFNYTYNVSPIWFAVCPDDEQMVQIDGMTAAASIAKLQRAIDQMKSMPELRSYNPSNGWGSYDTFLAWLEELMQAAAKNTKLTWRACR